MNVSLSDDRLDELLFEVCGSKTPEADFSKWEQTHPDAVSELRAAACPPAGVGSGEPFPLRIGAWIMNHRCATLATATAAVVLVAAVATWLYGGGKPDIAAQRGTRSETAGVRDVEPHSKNLESTHNGARQFDVSNKLAIALAQRSRSLAAARWGPVIVRGTFTAMEGTDLICKVTRVICGDVQGDRLRVPAPYVVDDVRGDLNSSLNREPSDAELRAAVAEKIGFQPGRDVILLLNEAERADSGVVYPLRDHHFADRRHSLDDLEKGIITQFWTGAVFIPHFDHDYDVAEFICSSERVVAARVVKVGDTSVQWKVHEVLGVFPGEGEQVDATPATISVSLHAWRHRAETLVRYHAVRQPGYEVTEERIERELDWIVKAEMWTGRDAVLFLAPRETADATYRLGGVLYEDPDDRLTFEERCKAIRKMITTGEYEDNNL